MGRVYVATPEEDALFHKFLKEEREPDLWLPRESTPMRPRNVADTIFSPRNFDEYIGQEEAKDLASIMVQAAHNERRALPNIMLVGEYGLGKTSLAKLIIQAAKVMHRMYDGSSINREFPEPGTFIIDEIHNLDSAIADSLNLKLDDGTFTIIGCTNQPGLLPNAFRSRFRTLHLKPYTTDNLKEIARLICEKKGVQYQADALELLALRSRFNARQVIQYLSLIFDMMSVKNLSIVSTEVVNDAFVKMGVDSRGLLPRDRDYLNALPNNRPVGLQYLAAVLGMDEKTIEQEVEPYLLRSGFIDRTSRGRTKIER